MEGSLDTNNNLKAQVLNTTNFIIASLLDDTSYNVGLHFRTSLQFKTIDQVDKYFNINGKKDNSGDPNVLE